MLKILYVLVTLTSLFALTSSIRDLKFPFQQSMFLPKNSLHLIPSKSNQMTETEFYRLIESAKQEYCPIIESYGANCRVSGEWEDTTVNAFALRYGGNWVVALYGGLARRFELTNDGFLVVICHELGHHLAGFTFKSFVLGDSWAATEGQSDYFAAHACLPNLWRDEADINAGFREKVDQPAKAQCDKVWDTQERRDLCYRIAMAAKSVTAMIARSTNRGPAPQFEKRSFEAVLETFENHPTPQCRLDTQFQAALCDQQFDDTSIPGDNVGESNRSIEAEIDSMNTTCHRGSGKIIGSRPFCWFKPRVSFDGLYLKEVKVAEVDGNQDGIFDHSETLAITPIFANRSGDSTRRVQGFLNVKIGTKISKTDRITYPDLPNNSDAEPLVPFIVQAPTKETGIKTIEIEILGESDKGKLQQRVDVQLGSAINGVQRL